jgi:hypothetical protein
LLSLTSRLDPTSQLKQQDRLQSMSHIVYWYGTTNPNHYYGFRNTILALETAQGRGVLEPYEAAKKKLLKAESMSKIENDKALAMIEIEQDLSKRRHGRRRGVITPIGATSLSKSATVTEPLAVTKTTLYGKARRVSDDGVYAKKERVKKERGKRKISEATQVQKVGTADDSLDKNEPRHGKKSKIYDSPDSSVLAEVGAESSNKSSFIRNFTVCRASLRDKNKMLQVNVVAPQDENARMKDVLVSSRTQAASMSVGVFNFSTEVADQIRNKEMIVMFKIGETDLLYSANQVAAMCVKDVLRQSEQEPIKIELVVQSAAEPKSMHRSRLTC